MDRGFLIGTALASALTFGGVLFLTAPAASTGPSAAAAPSVPLADLPAPAPDPAMEDAADAPTSDVYYANCDAARAAGVAPIYRGRPGYREEMDGDSDGIACEPYRGMHGIRVPRRARW
ncbi:MAG: excalibur calcium-binding domain-containing protein [Sphingomonas sp.]|jgi:hypothetical protein|uniref:excalibur calcium-binding domain-containing protein n=1 Tax=Sphingomonas sp. TaxID=28214 RepID=UPI00356201E5